MGTHGHGSTPGDGFISRVSADGKPTPIMKLVRGSADHTYLIAQQLLIIPLMNDNVLRAYRRADW